MRSHQEIKNIVSQSFQTYETDELGFARYLLSQFTIDELVEYVINAVENDEYDQNLVFYPLLAIERNKFGNVDKILKEKDFFSKTSKYLISKPILRIINLNNFILRLLPEQIPLLIDKMLSLSKTDIASYIQVAIGFLAQPGLYESDDYIRLLKPMFQSNNRSALIIACYVLWDCVPVFLRQDIANALNYTTADKYLNTLFLDAQDDEMSTEMARIFKIEYEVILSRINKNEIKWLTTDDLDLIVENELFNKDSNS